MNPRRALALLLILAGTLLCGFAALHYLRGVDAQSAGMRAFEKRLSAPPPAPADHEQPDRSGQPLARLRIPSARIDAIVFEGSDPAVLEKGPGHVPGTELPGRRTGWNNCVITAHRDSHFRNLGWLRMGQRIELESPEGKESYRVVSREIVDPEAVSVLGPTAERRLTLITCYPFTFIGPAPRRLVVVAELEPPAAVQRPAAY